MRTPNRVLLVLGIVAVIAISTVLGQRKPPETLDMQLEVTVPPPPAEILGFVIDPPGGELKPGDEVTLTAEAIVPEGGYLVAAVPNTSWQKRLAPAGGQRYRATAVVPELPQGTYRIELQMAGVKKAPAPRVARVRIAPAQVAVVPPPPPADSCNEIQGQVAGFPVRFPFNSSEPTGTSRSNLERVAEMLQGVPGNWSVTIVGHCDERGTVEFNNVLGMQRARATRDILLSRGSVAQTRVTVDSAGKAFPLDTGHDEAAWAKNRRVEFRLACE